MENSTWAKNLKARGTFSIIFRALEEEVLSAKNISRKLKLDSTKLGTFEGHKDSLECLSCPVKCNRNSFGAFSSMGPNLMIMDNVEIQNAIEICEKDALDPISAGAAIASLFNIQEDRRKLLNINLGMNWGDVQLYSLINDIINKENIGDQLSRGEAFLYQQTSEPSAIIKNQIGNMFYYPKILGISLMTGISAYKADNFRTELTLYPEILGIPFKAKPHVEGGKVEMVILLENLGAVLDSLVTCPLYFPFFIRPRRWLQLLPPPIQALLAQLFPEMVLSRMGLNLSLLQSLINKSVGLDLSFNDIIKAGNRIILLERLFNTRSGIRSDDDIFPLFLPKRKDFFTKYRSLLYNYYLRKGLTGTGLVSKEAIEEAGLLGLVTI